MPTSDIREFPEILSEVIMGGSKVKGVSHPDIPGFVVEVIERGPSGGSTNADSFVGIFEILKENRIEIVVGINCN
jgi:hypothetical protein